MKILSTLLLVPLDDIVVFPNMNVTISADVGEEDRVLLVPRHDGEYAKVGTVAEVSERVRLPGGVAAVSLVGLHRGIAGAAHTDAQGRLRVEVQEQPDVEPPGVSIPRKPHVQPFVAYATKGCACGFGQRWRTVSGRVSACVPAEQG